MFGPEIQQHIEQVMNSIGAAQKHNNDNPVYFGDIYR